LLLRAFYTCAQD